jgi:hypothetical protein
MLDEERKAALKEGRPMHFAAAPPPIYNDNDIAISEHPKKHGPDGRPLVKTYGTRKRRRGRWGLKA